MTEAVKVRGVPYRSFDEVEQAVRELYAKAILLPNDDDEREQIGRHVFELLDHLPDERAEALLTVITGGGGDDPSDDTGADPVGAEVDEKRGTVTIDGNEHPLCPMCLGIGYLDAEPPPDPTSERCPSCQGYGKVYTGSRVVGQATRTCPTCSGNGWRALPGQVSAVPNVVAASEFPEWPGARWNSQTLRWDPPPGEPPPWDNAQWNDMRGTWGEAA